MTTFWVLAVVMVARTVSGEMAPAKLQPKAAMTAPRVTATLFALNISMVLCCSGMFSSWVRFWLRIRNGSDADSETEPLTSSRPLSMARLRPLSLSHSPT